jgi:2'-5' RNA ligase
MEQLVPGDEPHAPEGWPPWQRDAEVSPVPARMADRWRSRAEPAAGEAQLYWLILMRDQPQVRALAALAWQRLAGFDGLHLTPERWLHLTVQRVGSTRDIPAAAVEAMVGRARHGLRPVPAAEVTLGRVLYHPEAIVLGVAPGDALDPVRAAVRQAADGAAELDDEETGPSWVPHVTVAYSTSEQPAGPIVAALGTELPRCPVTIDAVHLIAQHGAERDWNWQVLAAISLRPA